MNILPSKRERTPKRLFAIEGKVEEKIVSRKTNGKKLRRIGKALNENVSIVKRMNKSSDESISQINSTEVLHKKRGRPSKNIRIVQINSSDNIMEGASYDGKCGLLEAPEDVLTEVQAPKLKKVEDADNVLNALDGPGECESISHITGSSTLLTKTVSCGDDLLDINDCKDYGNATVVTVRDNIEHDNEDDLLKNSDGQKVFSKDLEDRYFSSTITYKSSPAEQAQFDISPKLVYEEITCSVNDSVNDVKSGYSTIFNQAEDCVGNSVSCANIVNVNAVTQSSEIMTDAGSSTPIKSLDPNITVIEEEGAQKASESLIVNIGSSAISSVVCTIPVNADNIPVVPEEQYNCYLCNEKFLSKGVMLKHLDDAHGHLMEVPKIQVGEMNSSVQISKVPMRQQMFAEPSTAVVHSSSLCSSGISYAYKSKVNSSKVSGPPHKSPMAVYCCVICFAPFISKDQLTEHKLSHSEPEDNRIKKVYRGRPMYMQCWECGQLIQRDEMSNHKRSLCPVKHPNGPPKLKRPAFRKVIPQAGDFMSNIKAQLQAKSDSIVKTIKVHDKRDDDMSHGGAGKEEIRTIPITQEGGETVQMVLMQDDAQIQKKKILIPQPNGPPKVMWAIPATNFSKFQPSGSSIVMKKIEGAITSTSAEDGGGQKLYQAMCSGCNQSFTSRDHWELHYCEEKFGLKQMEHV